MSDRSINRIFQTRHLRACSLSPSYFFSFSFFIKQPSRPLTRCHLNGRQDTLCAYTRCPYFATLPFFFPHVAKSSKVYARWSAIPRHLRGKMVGKIRGGSGEGTNKKIRDAFNAPSSPACSWINVARFSP